MKQKKFVSIIWGYLTHMYAFAPEENYHLHALKIAKELGYKPCAIVRQGKRQMIEDPHFDPDIEVIEYRNIFQFLFHIIRLSFVQSVFYVNSYEWQSFIVPFLARRTIFMAHTQPKRQTIYKQKIQNFVYKFFTAIRLNNEEEFNFLLTQGTSINKLHIVPLVVSQDIFKVTNFNVSDRKDLVYFGNITAKKNLPTIINAYEKVKEVKPDIKLHIIGRIHDNTVIDIINSSKHKAGIIQHGFLQNDQLIIELNKTLIYLNASFDEGQCVAVYDAALSGCALCLPNIMSFVGVFKDSALFHDVMDSKKMSENILNYIDNPELIERHQSINIDMIKKNYSIETIENKMKNLFSIFKLK